MAMVNETLKGGESSIIASFSYGDWIVNDDEESLNPAGFIRSAKPIGCVEAVPGPWPDISKALPTGDSDLSARGAAR